MSTLWIYINNLYECRGKSLQSSFLQDSWRWPRNITFTIPVSKIGLKKSDWCERYNKVRMCFQARPAWRSTGTARVACFRRATSSSSAAPGSALSCGSATSTPRTRANTAAKPSTAAGRRCVAPAQWECAPARAPARAPAPDLSAVRCWEPAQVSVVSWLGRIGCRPRTSGQMGLQAADYNWRWW